MLKLSNQKGVNLKSTTNIHIVPVYNGHNILKWISKYIWREPSKSNEWLNMDWLGVLLLSVQIWLDTVQTECIKKEPIIYILSCQTKFEKIICWK